MFTFIFVHQFGLFRLRSIQVAHCIAWCLSALVAELVEVSWLLFEAEAEAKAEGALFIKRTFPIPLYPYTLIPLYPKAEAEAKAEGCLLLKLFFVVLCGSLCLYLSVDRLVPWWLLLKYYNHFKINTLNLCCFCIHQLFYNDVKYFIQTLFY